MLLNGNEVCGAWSDELDVPVVLPIPSSLASNERTSYDGNYRISWNAVTGCSYTVSYELQEASSGVWPSENTSIYSGTAVFTDVTKTAADAVDYSYRVRACSSDVGCGPYSTQGVPPVNLTVTVDTLDPAVLTVADDPDPGVDPGPENPSYDGSFTLNWTSVEGALAYELQRKKRLKLEQGRPYGTEQIFLRAKIGFSG